MRAAAFKTVSVAGGMVRLALGAFIGTVIGASALFAWLETRPPDPHALLGGTAYNLLCGGLIGGFLGFFFGGAVGWVWLVVVVGREARRRATAAPNKPQEPASRAPRDGET
jgi:hypothetical protein